MENNNEELLDEDLREEHNHLQQTTNNEGLIGVKAPSRSQSRGQSSNKKIMMPETSNDQQQNDFFNNFDDKTPNLSNSNSEFTINPGELFAKTKAKYNINIPEKGLENQFVKISDKDCKYIGQLSSMNKAEGWGAAYNLDGTRKYEGEWKNNKRNGYGVHFYKDFTDCKEYEGYWVDDENSGLGMEFDKYTKELKWKGYFSESKRNGRGEFFLDGR